MPLEGYLTMAKKKSAKKTTPKKKTKSCRTCAKSVPTIKKVTKKAKKKIVTSKSKGPRPYKKCIDLMIKINEDIVDTGDYDDCILDELIELKKRLNDREKEVITRLGASVAKPRVIEIDEATPGGELYYKI